MRAIQISEDFTELATLLEEAKHENLILRTAEGVEFILAELDDFDREIELLTNCAALYPLAAHRLKSVVDAPK
ncbi:MAG: hypothetical protein SW833_21145 [Cyanobacteriota bacterium]|nr:hypothetical protein [Cyanobacteriota bacterium]